MKARSLTVFSSNLGPVTFEATAIFLGRKLPGSAISPPKEVKGKPEDTCRHGVDVKTKIEVCESERSNRKKELARK